MTHFFDLGKRHGAEGAIRLIRLGLPIGLSLLVEVSIFALIALFLSPLGALAVASHQITLNYPALVFAENIAEIYTRDPRVVAIAVGLLYLNALCQFSDAFQVGAAVALPLRCAARLQRYSCAAAVDRLHLLGDRYAAWLQFGPDRPLGHSAWGQRFLDQSDSRPEYCGCAARYLATKS
jgi:hypothetical protein